MGNRRSSPKKERKRYAFQLTLGSLLLLSVSLVFILAWVFSLGIMVGRGFLPSSIGGFSPLREKATHGEQKKKIEHVRPIQEEEFTFYNQLVNKKERTKKKLLSEDLLTNQDKMTKPERSKEATRNYSVQVAALKDKEKTKKLVERLTRLGYPAYYYQTRINDEIYYRIRCGPFPDLEEVSNCAKRLADKEGFKPFIVHPSNID